MHFFSVLIVVFPRPFSRMASWRQQPWRGNWNQESRQQESWNQESWNQQSWNQQAWEEASSSNKWRGKPRPGPARITSAQLQEQGQPAESEQVAREQKKWKDPKHNQDDDRALRCPWPGGPNTFPSWRDVVSDAAEHRLVQLLVLFFLNIGIRRRKNALRH